MAKKSILHSRKRPVKTKPVEAAGTISSVKERDSSLRVTKSLRDQLKAASAVVGKPLHEITQEAIEMYLKTIKMDDPLAAIRRRVSRKGT